ncbi:hypothetical protein LPJGGPFB_03163 [Ensifer adhaerens]|uniref:right-handed parallel beta-helix repeat-containing protein n=1 Tax=Ensifer adhaerens TaxID=106592 RepID=UPI0015698C08|nr:right-handed parallel beta-helix repeat-containing protein [Ensifer adhaerens]NRP19905.1 hypothetical protein [Ensifer adhaerens]
MSITSPDDRISNYSPVVPTTEFPAAFPIFDNADLSVYVDDQPREDFTVSATYIQGTSTDAKAVFSTGVTGKVQVIGTRAPRRSSLFKPGAPLPIPDQNLALNTLEAEVQELKREADRSHKANYGVSGEVFDANDLANAGENAARAEAAAQEVAGYDKAWTVFLDVIADGVNDTYLLADENGPKPVSVVDGQFFLNVHVGGAPQPSLPPADWPNIPYRIVEAGTKIQFSFVPLSGLRLYAKGAAGRASDPVEEVPFNKVYEKPEVYVSEHGTNKAAIVAAIAEAAANKRPLRFDVLPAGGFYDAADGNINLPSGIVLRGSVAEIRLNDTTLNPMFISSGSNVLVDGLTLKGNAATQTSASSGSAGLIFTGSTKPRVLNCVITDFTRHGILFEGCADPTAKGNQIERMWRGAGILVGSTLSCTGLSLISENRIKDVRQAHIQGYVPPERIAVVGNDLDNNNYGAGDIGDGISDNITFYSLDGGVSGIFANNTCKGSVNNGIHLGSDNLVVIGNIILSPVNAGLVIARKENVLPRTSAMVVVEGNTVVFNGTPTSSNVGIVMRDVIGACVTGNIVKNAYAGIQIAGLGQTPLLDMLTATGNTLIGCTNFGFWYRRNLRNVVVTGNVMIGNGGSSAHRLDVNSIDTITITNGGSGYTSATVAITGGGASGSGIATATATVVGGVVTGITITSYGFGYTSVPTVTISGDGTGATATATLFVVSGSDLRIFGNHEAGFSSLGNHVRMVQSSLFAPQLVFEGSTANLDAWLKPQGSGVLRLGYATAAATTPGNFTADRILQFKDDAGTVYRIPCRASAW